MLGILALIVFILWIIGFAIHLFGGLIHVVLLIAIVLAIAHFVRSASAPRM